MSSCGSTTKSCCGEAKQASSCGGEEKACSKQTGSLIGGQLDENELRNAVREHYKTIACSPSSCSPGSCFAPNSSEEYATTLGYTKEDWAELANGAIIGQGCGNPLAIAQLKQGEVVLDLGSGAGFDAFLAAKAVGETGYVIGVDMTPEMITKSRENIKKKNFKNVSFRLGELEYLPVADSSVNVIISNCVINLVQNKRQLFSEAYRVLKSGGRISISDLVTSVPLPESVRNDTRMFAGCVAGATLVSEMESILKESNFVDVKITPKDESKKFIKDWVPNSKLEDFIISAIIEARKP